jgi:hypothetical protein
MRTPRERSPSLSWPRSSSCRPASPRLAWLTSVISRRLSERWAGNTTPNPADQAAPAAQLTLIRTLAREHHTYPAPTDQPAASAQPAEPAGTRALPTVIVGVRPDRGAGRGRALDVTAGPPLNGDLSTPIPGRAAVPPGGPTGIFPSTPTQRRTMLRSSSPAAAGVLRVSGSH